MSTWLHVAGDGAVTVRSGKAELGQGILTAFAAIAAGELGVDPASVRVVAPHTDDGPDEGITAGSMSVATAGATLRRAAATARALFVAEAAHRLGVHPADVVVERSVLSAPGATTTTTYAELAGHVDLDTPVDASPTMRGPGPETTVARLDLPDKVTGRPRYLADLVLPGQLWGRVVRPPSAAATLVRADVEGAQALPGVVAVVRDGSFLGVVADDEQRAEGAAEHLRTRSAWDEPDTLPDEDDLPAYLQGGPSTTFTVDETGDPSTVTAARSHEATYSKPFLAHASIAPSVGAARWDGESLHVWSHTQGVFALRNAIAQALDLDVPAVVVEHVESAGCYGHNGADDAAFDAVLLARAVPGRPVQVRWSRRDELSWSPFGSAQLVRIVAGLDNDGRIASWDCDIWSQGHTSRPGYAGTPGLLAAAHVEGGHPLPAPVDPRPERGAGSARGAVPAYDMPVRRIRGHRLDRVALRSSSLRSLGAFANTFAIESFVDELAELAGADPLDYRLHHLSDPRGRAVLEAAVERAGWAGRPRGGGDVGWGVAVAQYKKAGWCAVVAEVEAVSDIRLRRLTLAVDVGRVVQEDGVRNQIEGGAVQSASWTLKERVRFDRCRVTSVDWETYPILRFSEVPPIDVVVLDRPDLPSVGAGEVAQGPTAAAIANALAAAVGLRVRDLPLTPDAVVAAMERG
ncbi:MAG TPA: molybdopterin cofactor-binding domain-containing protein [Actinomycetes bacterium]|nr:molybdopterin cofactor-binding domain-containing protein [Actinomycetes bacterium]